MTPISAIVPGMRISLVEWVQSQTERHPASTLWETGGTIACNSGSEGVIPGTIERVFDTAVSALAGDINTIMRVDSSQIDPDAWTRILNKLDVVSHRHHRSIFFTAAHSPMGVPGSDAQVNLYRALLLANSNLFRPAVYVVIGKDVFFGASISKINTKPHRGRYMAGDVVARFDDAHNLTFVANQDMFYHSFNPFFAVESEWIQGDVVTHGTDTLANTAYLVSLFYQIPRAIISFGQAELLDVDATTPLSVYQRAIRRVQIRKDMTSERQGLLIQGDLNDPEILAYLNQVAHDRDLPIFVYQPGTALPSLDRIIVLKGQEDIMKLFIKLVTLLGQPHLTSAHIRLIMQQNVLGEHRAVPDVRMTKIGHIPRNMRLIRATPGIDSLAIEDAIADLSEQPSPKLILAAYGDGTFPFSIKRSLVDRFRDHLSDSDYCAISQADMPTCERMKAIIEALHKQPLYDTLEKANIAFMHILRQDRMLDALMKVRESGIAIYVATLIPKVFPDLKKYEPGAILHDILGCHPLRVLFRDLNQL